MPPPGAPRGESRGRAVRRLTRAAAVLAVVWVLASPACAQGGSTTDILRGRVTDEENQPVVSAQVDARDRETGLRRTTRTGRDGRYTLVFPEGSGRYEVRVAFLGRAPAAVSVTREADEDVLVADVRLRARAVALEPIEVRGRRTATPGRSEAGSSDRTVSGEVAERLPLANADPAALATLSPGVVAVPGADSLGGTGFSVAGQPSSQNQVTLDGASFASLLSGAGLGGSGRGVPQEGVRGTRVVTSTYDVARGQFTGGQVEITTRSGTNDVRGSAAYRLRDHRLEGSTHRGAWADGATQQGLSAGVGGPLVRDRLFYFLSFSGQRGAEDHYALVPRTRAGLIGVGANPDSVARFLQIAQHRYGFPADGQGGAYGQTSGSGSLLARVDYLTGGHTVTLRGFAHGSTQDSILIEALDARQHGGELSGRGWAGVGTVTSRFGERWVNELRVAAHDDRRTFSSFAALPEARVRVATAGAEGAQQIATFAIGADPFLPRSARERTLEVADELSWLWGDAHRVKLGVLLNRFEGSQQTAGNRFGSFSFNSLAEFEAGRPASYTRSTSAGPARGGGWGAALYLGDAWRPAPRFQLTYGVRLEGSRFDAGPTRDARADSAFGLRTDLLPSELRLSPRVGFSWRLNQPGKPLRMLRGGFGEFRGRIPAGLYLDAVDADRAGGQRLLVCAGEGAVPEPDFGRFAADPASIPGSCRGEGAGLGGRPSVVGFGPGFGAPRSWRASLAYQAGIWRLLGGSVEASYARGVDLYRVQDLNLRSTPVLALAQEGGRPVFADPSAIDPATGAVGLGASRADPAFAHAFRLLSDARSHTGQLTGSVHGVVPSARLSFQMSYTLSHSRSQSSFAFGGARQGFASVPTAGDPNRLVWAPSDLDRRHSFVAVAGLPAGRSFELALIGRATSGAPYTPRVAGDINGDGAGNDIAFVFDPGRAADPAVAAGMRRLLAGSSGSARECLRGQLGRVAARNSCRGGWSRSVDLRSAWYPGVGGQRASVSAELFNLAAGLDVLLHGGDDLRGWGQGGARTNPVLLYPRGFDANSRAYRYAVNEAFGQNRSQRTTEGSPFAVQLAVRVTLGARPKQGPLGGYGDLGAPGIAAGALTRLTSTASQAGTGADVMVDDADEPGHGPSPVVLIRRVLPDPLPEVVALRDSLGLTPVQAARVEAIRDTLAARNDPIRDEVTRIFVAAWKGEGSAVAPTELFNVIGPRVNEGRRNIQQSLDALRAVLTPEQWARLPATVREAVSTGDFRWGRLPGPR